MSFDFIYLCCRPVFQRVSRDIESNFRVGTAIGHDTQILLTSQNRNCVRRSEVDTKTSVGVTFTHKSSHSDMEFWLLVEGKMLLL